MLYKYPRTMHLPWSPGLQSDDKVIRTLDGFVGKRVVVTEKMDGENATLYRNCYHARSIDSKHHVSRDWIKSFHSTVKNSIPENWRICGENLYAEHSIKYDNLPSYFMGFSVWTDENICLSWEDTIEWFELIGVVPVNVWWLGAFEDFMSRHTEFDNRASDHVEGYVIRIAEAFPFNNFENSVGKFVRKGHVQTSEHWMHKPVIANKLLFTTK